MEYCKSRKTGNKTLRRIYDLLEDEELRTDLKKVINSLRDDKYLENKITGVING